MNNIQLSIIVPVYNVEKYLSKCLDSLVEQDDLLYEIIVVNDGATDNSHLIIDEYKKKYPNLINSVSKQNGGLASARNYGLKFAKGKYIGFIDSDDYVEKNHYTKMVRMAEEESADLVVTDFEYYWENGTKESIYKNGLEYVNENLNKCMFLSPLFSWNKLYKRDLFEQLHCQYPEGLWYEDIPVTLLYSVNAKKICHLSSLGFHYTQRESSIMGTKYSPKMEDIFTIFKNVHESFCDRNILDIYHDEIEYLFIEHFLVYGAFRFLRTDMYKELLIKAFRFVREYFPNYKKNKYIYTLGKKNTIFLKTLSPKTIWFWRLVLLWRDK